MEYDNDSHFASRSSKCACFIPIQSRDEMKVFCFERKRRLQYANHDAYTKLDLIHSRAGRARAFSFSSIGRMNE